MLSRISRNVTIGTIFAIPALAAAQAPRITDIRPAGIPRAQAADLTIRGERLDAAPQLHAPFPAVVETLPNGNDAATWHLRVTPAPGVPTGVYPVRVQTKTGLSNPFPLVVDQWPQTTEIEPNDQPEAATSLQPPIVVEGEAKGTDVDHFRFHGLKGQQLVIDALAARIGSPLDPQIRLTTADGRFVEASDDVAGLLTDARIILTLPADDDYILELSDTRYQGPERAIYRVRIGEIPVAATVFPLGGRRGEILGVELSGGTLPTPTLAAVRLEAPPGESLALTGVSATALGLNPTSSGETEIPLAQGLAVSDLTELREPITPPLRAVPPVVLNGQIVAPGAVDRFRVTVTPGRAYRATVEASQLGSPLDGVLQVLKPDGSQLANADDGKLSRSLPGQGNAATEVVVPDPSLDFTPPEGVTEVDLALKDLQGRPGPMPYRITVREVTPTLQVTPIQTELSIPSGGTALITVTLVRQGIDGPVTLEATNLPEGLTARPITVAPGQVNAVFSLTSSTDTPFDVRLIALTAKSGDFSTTATRHVVFAQRDNLPILERDHPGLYIAPASPLPAGVDTPAEPITVYHGLGGNVPISVTRGEGGQAELKVTGVPLPGGFTVPEATVPADASEATIKIDVAPEAPLGPSTIGLIASGKFGEVQHQFHLPAVTLDVQRPISIEIPTEPLAIKPGETIELKGKLERRGGFDGPVTLKLDPLPAGLTVEPVTLEAATTDFTLNLVTAADAADSTATPNLVPAFKIGDKDYAYPPIPLNLKIAK